MAKKTEKSDRFEIRTPNPTFSGIRSGVQFRSGQALTGNAASAAGMASLGLPGDGSRGRNDR